MAKFTTALQSGRMRYYQLCGLGSQDDNLKIQKLVSKFIILQKPIDEKFIKELMTENIIEKL